MGNELHNLARVYQMLADEESKDIYLKRLNYLVTYNFDYIHRIRNTYLPQLPPWDGTPIADVFMRLPGNRNFILYGAGQNGALLLPYCKENKRFAGFCSKTIEKQKNGYLGCPVMSPEELLARRDLNVIVATSKAKAEIMQILIDGGYPQELIFDGGKLFSKASEASDPEQYFSPNFMTYADEEVFVDAGSFDLGTSLKLKEYAKNLKKVYAFEPDPVCYQRCLKKKAQTNFTEAEIFPYGTWSTRTTFSFNASNDGSSRISKAIGESTRIDVVPIDEVIDPSDKVTFIKMDVEGSELESLKGAKQTIRRDKPKLAICIYHKPEDMTVIPLYIKELVPEYKLYVRHHSNNTCETVLYAIIP